MYNEAMTFFSGERRYIKAQVFPEDKNETVVVNSADFKLIEMNGGAVIREGKCEVHGGDTAIILLDLTEVPKGNYELRVTMEALPEKIIGSQEIEVLK